MWSSRKWAFPGFSLGNSSMFPIMSSSYHLCLRELLFLQVRVSFTVNTNATSTTFFFITSFFEIWYFNEILCNCILGGFSHYLNKSEDVTRQ